MKNFYYFSILFLLISYQLLGQTNVFINDPVSAISVGGMTIIDNDLYFCNFDYGKISKVDITSTNPVIIDVVTGLNYPKDILIHGNELYISEYYGNKISKIDITETNPTLEDVVTGLNHPKDILIHDNELYFSETGKISKVNILETNPTLEDVVTGLDSPTSIELYGNDLYVIQATANKISKFNITDTNPSVTDVITNINARALLIRNNNLYVSEDSDVSKIDLTEANLQPTNIASGFCCVAYQMALNENVLFTSQMQSGHIYKTILNSLSVENIEKSNIIIYPNPSVDFIHIDNLDKEQKYIVYDKLGRKISTVKRVNNNTIDIRQLSSGLYFLKFKNGNTIKFIKQ